MSRYSMTEEVRAIVEWTTDADSLEEAQAKFSTGEFDGEERIIDILETLEELGIEKIKQLPRCRNCGVEYDYPGVDLCFDCAGNPLVPDSKEGEKS